MAKIRVKISDFTDKQIFDLANEGCFPAFADLILRSRKKNKLNHLVRLIDEKFKISFSYPKNFSDIHSEPLSSLNRERIKLRMFHKRLNEIPLRYLVSPLNGSGLNKSLLKTKLSKTIYSAIYKLNSGKFKLDENEQGF